MQVKFTLPLAPTVNHYMLRQGNLYFPSKEYKIFQQEVKYRTIRLDKFGSLPLEIYIGIHFKDNRRQDISNRIKCTEDALVKAGLFDDDRQVIKLRVERLENSNPPYMEVEIKSLD